MGKKEIVFVSGMRVSKPAPRAPDTVLANLQVNKAEFIEWLHLQDGEVVKISMLQAKSSDNWYLALNQWKPGQGNGRDETSEE